MKKIIGMLVFLMAFSANVDAKTTTFEKVEIVEESCVSIAGELTKDRPDLFALAYNYCIKQRCGCNL